MLHCLQLKKPKRVSSRHTRCKRTLVTSLVISPDSQNQSKEFSFIGGVSHVNRSELLVLVVQ
eukprot:1677807-Amphidinium_carterae.1